MSACRKDALNLLVLEAFSKYKHIYLDEKKKLWCTFTFVSIYKVLSLQNIHETLKSVSGGALLIEEMTTGIIGPKTRKRVVNTLVSDLIMKHGKQ